MPTYSDAITLGDKAELTSAGCHLQGRNWWDPMGTGRLHGRNISMQFTLPTHTTYSSLRSTTSILSTNSDQSQLRCESSAMTQLPGSGSMNMATLTLGTPMNSSTSLSITLEVAGVQVPEELGLKSQEEDDAPEMEILTQVGKGKGIPQSAVSSMQWEGAHRSPASSFIIARNAMGVIHDGSARMVSKCQRSRDLGDRQDGKRPRYMRFIFGKGEVGRTPSATYTEVASPVPGVPASDYQYQDITETLSKYPHLFKIITPINADRFETLLSSHPNQPLVKSICAGLQHGFWPFADTEDPGRQPLGVVARQSSMPNLDEESIKFLLRQRDKEIELT